MFVGHAENHSRDVYRMLNLTTNSITSSCNIICLNKICKEWKNAKTTIHVDDEEKTEIPTGIEKTKSTTNSTKDIEDENNKSNKKVFRVMKNLESWFMERT
jgi:hypothetical protein